MNLSSHRISLSEVHQSSWNSTSYSVWNGCAIELPVPDGTHTSDLAKVIVELLNWVQTSSFAEVWDGNNWVGKMAEEDSYILDEYKQEILNLAS